MLEGRCMLMFELYAAGAFLRCESFNGHALKVHTYANYENYTRQGAALFRTL